MRTVHKPKDKDVGIFQIKRRSSINDFRKFNIHSVQVLRTIAFEEVLVVYVRKTQNVMEGNIVVKAHHSLTFASV